MGRLACILASATLLAVSTSRAEPATPPESAPAASSSPASEAESPARAAASSEPASAPAPARVVEAKAEATDAGWELYSRAFDAYLQGELAESRRLLDAIQREQAGHPAAKRARATEQLLEKMQRGERPGTEVAPQAPAGPQPMTRQQLGALLRNESPSALARAELAIIQTINGIGVGAEACVAADCHSTQLGIGLAITGGALGLGLSLGLTRDGITPGRALATNTGSAWGFWNGLALVISNDLSDQKAGATLMAGQLLGTAAGLGASLVLHPSAGDVALGTTGGLWSGVLALLVINAAKTDWEDNKIVRAVLAASDLGFVAGASLSNLFPMSRSRTLILDSGALLGMLLGFGVDVLADSKAGDRSFLVAGSVGLVGGLAAAGYVTRNWDLPELPQARVAMVPNRGGASVLVGLDF
jgi:hypothetical protein